MSRVQRIVIILALVVIAAALSVSTAMTVVERLQSAEESPGAADVLPGDFTATHVVTEVSPAEAMTSRNDPGDPLGGFPAPDIVVEGQGTAPAQVDLAPGLWIAEIRFIGYTPPTLGEIPGVTINSRGGGSGGMAWSGSEWAPLFVGEWRHPGRVATFLSGDILAQVTAIPEDVRWVLRFTPLGDLKRP